MQQQSQTKNTVIFVVVMALCLGVWAVMRYYVFPPPPPPVLPEPPVPAEVYQAAETFGLGAGAGGLDQGLTQVALRAQEEGKPPEAAPAPPPVQPPPVIAARPPTPEDQLKTLGDIDRNSKYHLFVTLDPRGAAVRRVVLNKFNQADHLGRPVTKPDGTREPLTLVPDDAENPSNQLLHFNVHNRDDDKPFETLGKVDWTVVATPAEEPAADGRQSWTFVSPPVQGFVVTKTFSLTPGEYHIGLEVKVKRVGEPGLDDKPAAFRYQLTGAHGLPVEGRWYTNYFRNALIGQVENKPGLNRYVARDYQDLRQTSAWEGGTPVDRQQGYLIRYAGVAVQYFASAVVVDDKQDRQDFLVRARPTMERAVVKGVVKSVDADLKRFVLTRTDNGKDETFFVTEEDLVRDEQQIKDRGAQYKAEFHIPFHDLAPGLHTAVVYTTGGFDEKAKQYPEYARELRDDAETQPLWENDVTVRVATEPVELKTGEEFTHKYLLYNGPVKVMLLGQPDSDAETVAPGLVSRYIDDLNLNTLTDYQSPSWIGNVTGPLGISWMLIQITNIMHWVLWFLHHYLWIPYILCIVCLTVMVRGMMFPVSRKQAMTSLRMQQLAPELKKLQEKFKDDKPALTAAQMELYRKNGVNPFGTCWLLALQMPIFMGLYYSLQESIHFRLQGLLSPWWIPNLSAPDMLVYWNYFGPVPFIGQPSWYGWLFYLGPYLNILPILAVSLMLVQQKWTMPPPTDEQQEQQQKMMKYMMVFMGLMFYKVASGLCIYFIASSLWGFMERQMLPKKKPILAGAAPPAEEKPQTGIMSRLLGPKGGNGSSTAVTSGKGKRGKRRQEKATDDGDGSMLQRLRDWWDGILEQARKK